MEINKEGYFEIGQVPKEMKKLKTYELNLSYLILFFFINLTPLFIIIKAK